ILAPPNVTLYTRLVVAMLVACTCPVGNASGAPNVKLTVGFHPNTPGQRTTISLSLRVRGNSGTPPSPVRSFDLRLPSNMGIATTTLGQANCNPAALIASGLAGCSRNARVGYGTARATIPYGTQSIQETASLNAVMGPVSENKIEILWYIEADQP